MMRPMPMASMQARRAGVPTSINLSTAIVCTRASEASYQTGAETDGSSSFLAWATANVLRVQNRGSRNAIFVEGARTNLLVRSQDITNVAGWTVAPAPNRSVQTGAANAGPDGANLATRVQSTSAQFSSNQNVNPGSPSIATMWARAVSGSSPSFLSYYNPRSGSPTAATSLSTTYQRLRSRIPTLTDVGSFYPHDGTLTGAAPSDIYIGLTQVEAAHFASSVIRTTTAAVTRNADACVIASASIPAWLRSGKWQCTISLECTSAEFIAAATEMTLFAFSTGTNDRISLVLDSGAMKVRVTQGGATKVTTGAITATSRYLDITLTFDAAAGSVTVAGATTGNGTTTATAWTMQAGDVYVGNGSGGTTPYFGEILPTVSEVP